MNTLFSVLLLAVSAYSAQAVFSSGKCLEIPAISNFEVNSYIGNWYEIRRLNSVFERQLKCGRAIYQIESSNSISVENNGINAITGEIASVVGHATFSDTSAKNKLTLMLPVEVAGVTIFENEGEYSVWDTDYDSYALIYSCKTIIPGLVKAETSWILSRERTLSDEKIRYLSSVLAVDGLDINKFEVVDQSDCE